MQKLGFGFADVVVAVPEYWIDVATVADLEDIAFPFRRLHGRWPRVATKYTNMTRRFFASKGFGDYRIIESAGATEGAPAAGTAELIVDITTTGETLRANGLKILDDGIILKVCRPTSAPRTLRRGRRRFDKLCGGVAESWLSQCRQISRKRFLNCHPEASAPYVPVSPFQSARLSGERFNASPPLVPLFTALRPKSCEQAFENAVVIAALERRETRAELPGVARFAAFECGLDLVALCGTELYASDDAMSPASIASAKCP